MKEKVEEQKKKDKSLLNLQENILFGRAWVFQKRVVTKYYAPHVFSANS